MVFQWIDLIWVPLVFAVVDKTQRWKATGFVLGCILALRLQNELLEEFHLSSGLLPFLDSPVFTRGIIVYGVFILLYLWLSKYYKHFDPFIFLAASLTLFGIAFCVSSVVMLL